MAPFHRDTIRDLRESLGMSQREFADHLSVPQTTVNRWETGRTTPNAEYLGMMYDLAQRHSRTFTPFADSTPTRERAGIAREAASEWLRRSRGPRGKDPASWRELFLQMLALAASEREELAATLEEAEGLAADDLRGLQGCLDRAQGLLPGGAR